MFLFVIFCLVNLSAYTHTLWEVDRAKEANQRTYPLNEYVEHEKAAAPLLSDDKMGKANEIILEKYKK